MKSILDVLYWFYSHHEKTEARNILREPCVSDSVSVYSHDDNLARTLAGIKQITKYLDKVSKYNQEHLAGNKLS